MSFGFGSSNSAFGGQSGFGSSSQTQQVQGGFGSSTAFGQGATASSFGQPATSAFGQNTTASTFGQPSTNTLGTTPSSFGASRSSAFGTTSATPSAFGGSQTANAGGGFGSGSAFGSTGGGFGSASTAGFGTATASPFGGASGTGGGFGSAQTGAFGSTVGQTSGLGTSTTGFGNVSSQSQKGTGHTPYNTYVWEDNKVKVLHTTITALPQYNKKSVEELRYEDYCDGRKRAGAASGGSLGGGFAQQPQQNTFGTPASTSGAFGFGQTQAKPSAFGSSTAGGGGVGGIFGSTPTTTSGFGSSSGGGAFGQKQTAPFGAKPATSAFGGGGAFGSTAAATTGGVFGNTSSGFGATPTATFGTTPQTSGVGLGLSGGTGGFGATSGMGAFGQSSQTTSSFGQASGTSSSTPSAFGGGGGVFGQTQQQSQTTSAQGGFGLGNAAPATGTTGLFGAPTTSTSTFGSTAGGNGIFGTQPKPAQTPDVGGFGQPGQQAPSFGGFGGTGGVAQASTSSGASAGGLFSTPAKSTLGGATGSVFGGAAQQTQQSGLGGALGGTLQTQAQTPIQQQTPLNIPQMTAQQGRQTLTSADSYPALEEVKKLSLVHQQHAEQRRKAKENESIPHKSPFFVFSTPSTQNFRSRVQEQSAWRRHRSPRRRRPMKLKVEGDGVARSPEDIDESLVSISPDSEHIDPNNESGTLSNQSSPKEDDNGCDDNTSANVPTVGNGNIIRTVREKMEYAAPSSCTTPIRARPSFIASPASTRSSVNIHSQQGTGTVARIDGMTSGSQSQSAFKFSGMVSNLPPISGSPSIQIRAPSPLKNKPDYPLFTITEGEDLRTSPPLSELQDMSLEQLSAVVDFTVISFKFGKVLWRRPVDIASLHHYHGNTPLDKIVVFSHKCVDVYLPSDEDGTNFKPEVGEGLNLPARITLYNCYPKKKNGSNGISTTRITSFDAEVKDKWERILDKASEKSKTTNSIFEWDTGRWSFDVESFSDDKPQEESEDCEDGNEDVGVRVRGCA
eukprot:CFRG0600T1